MWAPFVKKAHAALAIIQGGAVLLAAFKAGPLVRAQEGMAGDVVAC